MCHRTKKSLREMLLDSLAQLIAVETDAKLSTIISIIKGQK
jgi:hypothetical protein